MNINFMGLLFLLFLGLKLAGIITWSWLWITLPLWGGFVAVIGLVAMVGIAAVVLSPYVKLTAEPKKKK